MSAVGDLKPRLEASAELLLSTCLIIPLNPGGLQHDLTSCTNVALGATKPGHVYVALHEATLSVPRPL